MPDKQGILARALRKIAAKELYPPPYGGPGHYQGLREGQFEVAEIAREALREAGLPTDDNDRGEQR